MKSSPFKSPKGFTLLEVAVALAILATAIAAISTLQAKNLTLTAENKAITAATLSARSLWAQLLAGELPLEDGEGDLGEDFPGWRYRLQTEDMTDSGLQRVEISVFQEEKGPENGTDFWFVIQKEEAP